MSTSNLCERSPSGKIEDSKVVSQMSAEDWARVSAIAAITGAVCTFLAPLFALRVSAWLNERAENHKRKLEIFQTLMQWRMATFAERPVQALNVIDVLFHDVKSVRDAWQDLYAAYLDARLQTEEGGRIRQDKLNALLTAMASHLGYRDRFSSADFERVYNPEVLNRLYLNQVMQANKTFEELQAQRSTRSVAAPANKK